MEGTGSTCDEFARATAARSWCKTALAEAGLVPMTLHDLRHTAASMSISTGANVKAVQRMLGHASAAMALDIDADLFDDDLNAVSDRLDQAYERSAVGKPRVETNLNRAIAPRSRGSRGYRKRGDGGI